MKKIFLSAILGLTFISVNAQRNFEIGPHIGIPVNDTSYPLSFNLGLNVAYTTNLTTNFKLGLASGYTHFFRKDIGTDFPVIPIAAKAKYKFSGTPIFADLDLGYGISVSNSFKGGFYAYPKVGYKFSAGEIYLGYQHLSTKYNFDYYDITTNIKNNNSFSIGSINLGYTYTFK